MMKYKIGIALGGGGARGFAHLGAVKALLEKGINADIYAGTSAGALAGAYLAAGSTPDDVFELMHRSKLSDYTKMHLPIDGLLSLEGMTEKLRKTIRFKNIEELPVPLIIAASNFNSGTVEYFINGNLATIVSASCSIPVLFSPIKIGNVQYADGGVFDNVPVAPLRSICETVIGINLMPIERTVETKNLIEIALRTFQLTVDANTQISRKQADYFIELNGIQQYGLLNPSNAEALFNLGYNSVRRLNIDLAHESNIS